MSKLALSEQVVRVETLEDLCKIVRYNNDVFAHHINKLDARSRSTRKWLGTGFIMFGFCGLCIEARLCNIEDRLKKHEERLGIATEEE